MYAKLLGILVSHMTKQHFSFKEIFMFGWAKTQQHAWFIVLTFIIMGVITNSVGRSPFLGGIVHLLVGLSLTSIALTMVRGHHFTFADLFTPILSRNKVLKYVGLSLMYIIPLMFAISILNASFIIRSSMFALPLALLGALLGLLSLYSIFRFMFYPFLVIEHENTKFVDLIKISHAITGGPNLVPSLIFFALVIILNAVGALVVVGLFITVPISLLATAHMYTRLSDHHTV